MGLCAARRIAGFLCFFFQAEDGIRDLIVTGVQTCALPIWALEIGVRNNPHVGQNLFGNLTKHWRGHVTPMVGPGWFIDNYNYHYRWIIYGSKTRSEEHTSELQSRSDLVCRLLLEKKKKQSA